jgi:hypothetical protein
MSLLGWLKKTFPPAKHSNQNKPQFSPHPGGIYPIFDKQDNRWEDRVGNPLGDGKWGGDFTPYWTGYVSNKGRHAKGIDIQDVYKEDKAAYGRLLELYPPDEYPDGPPASVVQSLPLDRYMNTSLYDAGSFPEQRFRYGDEYPGFIPGVSIMYNNEPLDYTNDIYELEKQIYEEFLAANPLDVASGNIFAPDEEVYDQFWSDRMNYYHGQGHLGAQFLNASGGNNATGGPIGGSFMAGTTPGNSNPDSSDNTSIQGLLLEMQKEDLIARKTKAKQDKMQEFAMDALGMTPATQITNDNIKDIIQKAKDAHWAADY